MFIQQLLLQIPYQLDFETWHLKNINYRISVPLACHLGLHAFCKFYFWFSCLAIRHFIPNLYRNISALIFLVSSLSSFFLMKHLNLIVVYIKLCINIWLHYFGYVEFQITMHHISHKIDSNTMLFVMRHNTVAT